jgi:hypothetical protein
MDGGLRENLVALAHFLVGFSIGFLAGIFRFWLAAPFL